MSSPFNTTVSLSIVGVTTSLIIVSNMDVPAVKI
ncbi:hypothetical protein A2U01_0033596, partial [Trifolium medium]|nr:hypothetical protein [Trifolium medium]